MQTVFPVKLPVGTRLDVELLAELVAKRSGVGARGAPVVPGTNAGGIEFETGAYVQLVVFEGQEVGVAYDSEPTYFEWATLAQLAELGADLSGERLPQEAFLTWSDYQARQSNKKEWWRLW